MKNDDKPPVTRDSDKFMLRLPDGMRDQISDAAKRNNRSMNAEIVARLGDSLAREQISIQETPLVTLNYDKALQDVLNRFEARLNDVKVMRFVDLGDVPHTAATRYVIIDESHKAAPPDNAPKRASRSTKKKS